MLKLFVAALVAVSPAFIAVSPAFAQNGGTLATACGPKGITFDAIESSATTSPAAAIGGKAQVVFIQDDGIGGNHQHYTTIIGMDGKWVGAYKHNAYFILNVDPGEHHVCANVQSQSNFGKTVALAHFNAEAGKVYYFRTQFLAGLTTAYPTYPYLNLDRPDSDEAQYLMGTSPVSSAVPRK